MLGTNVVIHKCKRFIQIYEFPYDLYMKKTIYYSDFTALLINYGKQRNRNGSNSSPEASR